MGQWFFGGMPEGRNGGSSCCLPASAIIAYSHYGIINERLWLLVRQEAEHCLNVASTGAKLSVLGYETRTDVDGVIVFRQFSCTDIVFSLGLEPPTLLKRRILTVSLCGFFGNAGA
jgi:hypothetical protein